MSTISASTTSTTAYKVTADTTGTLVLQTGSTPTTAVTIDTSQNVGIGTSSPAAKLNTYFGTAGAPATSGSTDASLAVRLGVQTVGLDFGTYSSGSSWIQNRSASNYALNYDLVLQPNGGNVGVGTSSPAINSGGRTIHIHAAGTNQWSLLHTTNGETGANAGDGTIYGQIGLDGYVFNYEAGNLIFGTSSTERARIDSSGNLLVGTTSVLDGASGIVAAASSTGGGVAGGLYVRNTASSGGDASPPLVVSKTMTTTTSSARFIQFYANGTATAMGGIVGNGASNVQFAALSDVREKTNIQSISGSLEKISLLRPVEFDWIADGTHVNAGFIAQEVEPIFPEFVIENVANDGQEERKGLTGGMTGGIIPHLVKAIQELKAELDAAKADIATLKGAA